MSFTRAPATCSSQFWCAETEVVQFNCIVDWFSVNVSVFSWFCGFAFRLCVCVCVEGRGRIEWLMITFGHTCYCLIVYSPNVGGVACDDISCLSWHVMERASECACVYWVCDDYLSTAVFRWLRSLYALRSIKGVGAACECVSREGGAVRGRLPDVWSCRGATRRSIVVGGVRRGLSRCSLHYNSWHLRRRSNGH